jgi:hypothetical protein
MTKITTEELLEEKYQEITRLYAIIEVRDTLIAELEARERSSVPGLEKRIGTVSGTPVLVYNPRIEGTGGTLLHPPLFSGYLAPGAPWMFWNRVIPADQYIDLPPMYRIERLEKRS